MSKPCGYCGQPMIEMPTHGMVQRYDQCEVCDYAEVTPLAYPRRVAFVFDGDAFRAVTVPNVIGDEK